MFRLQRLMLFVVVLVGAPAFGQLGDTITWKSTTKSTTGAWSDPTQWDLGRVPEDGDTVILVSPTDVIASYSFMTTTATGPLPATGRFKKLEIRGAHRLRMSGWDSKISTEVLDLRQATNSDCGGTIDCQESSSTSSNRVWVVADTITMGKNSVISATGYDKGLGPCWDEVTSPSGSGCHGGLGSSGTGHVYGDLKYPKSLGSGAIGNTSAANSTGGGAVWLQATTITLNGRIGANGGSSSYNTAAGSGGSVLIECETISGSGRVSADGGGYVNLAALYENGSAGGGGRIAVHYDSVKQSAVDCDVTFEARGGQTADTGSVGGDPTGRYRSLGQSGTVYLTDDRFTKRAGIKLSGRVYYGAEATQMNTFVTDGDCNVVDCYPEFGDDAVISIGGNLTISSTRSAGTRQNGILVFGTNAMVTVGGNLSLANAQLKIANGGKVHVGGNVLLESLNQTAKTGGEIFISAGDPIYENNLGGRFDVDGDWTVNSYSGVFAGSNPTNGTIVALSSRNFSLQNAAVLSGDALGYGERQGPGAATAYATGASHAGRGVSYTTGAKSGTVYGNSKLPLTAGSGAARVNGQNFTPPSGGSVVWLTTAKDMTLNGAVSANGGNADTYTCSAAGGSVLLQCGRLLSGTTGMVSANGGNSPNKGGTAGGGRVAIYYGSLAQDFTLPVSALGGRYFDKDKNEKPEFFGEDGTVFWKQVSKGLILIFK